MTKPVDVVLVTAPGCHFCDEAGRLLDDMAVMTPLAVRTVALSSDEGRVLLVRHPVPYLPTQAGKPSRPACRHRHGGLRWKGSSLEDPCSQPSLRGRWRCSLPVAS